MNKGLFFATLALTAAAVAFAEPSPQTPRPDSTISPAETLQSEVLISTLPTEDLKKQIAAEGGKIEHKSEVARGGPVAAVVRSTGCLKDTAGQCNINANVTVYRPDGSVFHEAKVLDLSPTGRIAVPLNIDANAGTGLYKVVVTVRDLTARRFAVLERQFAVK
jgi:5-hydroxyisourate hydrolase-like protein (transthyretin family)